MRGGANGAGPRGRCACDASRVDVWGPSPPLVSPGPGSSRRMILGVSARRASRRRRGARAPTFGRGDGDAVAGGRRRVGVGGRAVAARVRAASAGVSVRPRALGVVARRDVPRRERGPGGPPRNAPAPPPSRPRRGGTPADIARATTNARPPRSRCSRCVSVLVLVPGSPRARGPRTPEDVASDAAGDPQGPSARPRRREPAAREASTARGAPPRPPPVGRVRGPSFGEGDNFHRRKSADLREMRARGS